MTQKKRKEYSLSILDTFSGLDNDWKAVLSRTEANVTDWRLEHDDAKLRKIIIDAVSEVLNSSTEIINLGNYIKVNSVMQSFLQLQRIPLSNVITLGFDDMHDPNNNFWDLSEDLDFNLIWQLLPPYSLNRGTKYHLWSSLFANNEIQISETKKTVGEDGSVIDSGELVSGDPIIPDINVVQYFKQDAGETFNGEDMQGTYVYPQNNIQKITIAICDLYEQYISGNSFNVTTSNCIDYKNTWLDYIPNSMINIKTGVSNRTNLTVNTITTSKTVTILNGSTINPDIYKYPFSITNKISNNKYVICGTTDNNNNLISWQVCKVYNQTETSTRNNGQNVNGRWGSGMLNYIYDKKYTYTWSYKIDRVRNITDGPINGYSIYPKIYFSNTNIIYNIFNELKNQYVKCINNIPSNSIYTDMLNMQNKSIQSINDIKWLYNSVQNFWDNIINPRINEIYLGVEADNDYKKVIHDNIYKRINKDDGTLWDWYKGVTTTDMLYKRYTKRLEDSKELMKKLAVWKFAQDAEKGTYFIYIEKAINKYYSNNSLYPNFKPGNTIYIMDDTSNIEQMANIVNVYTESTTVYGDVNNDGETTIYESGTVEGKTDTMFKIEIDRLLSNTYLKDENGRMVLETK